MISAEKTITELWQNYLFLTQEMNKFLDKQDHDMFLDLLEQRERLQPMIEGTNSQEFVDSKQGSEIIAEISQFNHIIANKVQHFLNREHKNQNLSRAYDSFRQSNIGMRMDWKS